MIWGGSTMFLTILVLLFIPITAITAYKTGRYLSMPKNNYQVASFEPFEMVEKTNEMAVKSDEEKMLQGFSEALLVVNAQLLIEKTKNSDTIDFFIDKIENQKISEVLFNKDETNRRDIDAILNQLFITVSDDEKERLLHLLPKQLHHLDRFFKLNYIYSDDSKHLFIYVSDVSATLNLVEQAEDEIAELEMVIAVLTHQKEYVELKQFFYKFINEDIEQFFSFTDEIVSIKNLLRHTLHIIKLNCIKLKFVNSLSAIQRMEEAIERISTDSTITQFKSKVESLNMTRLLEADQRLLAEYINEEILDARYLTIDYEALMEVERLVKVLPESSEKQAVLNRLNRIRFISIVDIVNRFDKYARDLSKRISKKLNPLHYSGPNVLFDEDEYKDIINGFIELVTNAIEHGIEFPADRYRNDKSEHGNITVTLSKLGTGYQLGIEDDGRGVDINGIKEILYETKRFPFDEIVEMTDQEVINCVFLDGISTYVSEDHKSTKGTGLFMLKERVETIGGEIKVHSEQNKYTRFDIFIPTKNDSNA